MQHVEFLDKDHFKNNYLRVYPTGELARFIDFFWQTDFEHLWAKYPAGFSDALLPNIGYTYLVNLGTPFIMQVDEERFSIKGDSFLPRHSCIECFHHQGCRIFGIKFRISPILLEKKVNFSEYKKSMAPLSYLIDKDIISRIKADITFQERVAELTGYFNNIISKSEVPHAVSVVSDILEECSTSFDFTVPVEELAAKHGISSRTLQRYFEQATSLGTKQTLQILRARKAIEQLASGSPIDLARFGYYDQSHFYKHMKQFMEKGSFKGVQNLLGSDMSP